MPLCPTTRRLLFLLSILAFAIVPAFAIDEPLYSSPKSCQLNRKKRPE